MNPPLDTDLTGSVAVVTGANSGIGYAMTHALAEAGATVVMACRNRDRGESAVQRLAQTIPRERLDLRLCDLADLSSVRSFAESIRTSFDRLDLLCNNAGIMAVPYRETVDGFESQVGVNHLGHFALTGELVSLITETDEARIITQSSMMHTRASGFDWSVHEPSGYDRMMAYAQSKLANASFAIELDRRLAAAGFTQRSHGCEPGFVHTNLFTNDDAAEGRRLRAWGMGVLARIVGQRPADGARPMLHAATADLDRGAYVRPSRLGGMRGPPTVDEPSQPAVDREIGIELWERSAAMTETAFDRLDPPAISQGGT